ncbi:uncharacterized protein PHALS_03262 [Plasmopara halstedii]|uniref:Uncharacterized protein n=1 Tax=Plasmopara halstedii TaxID=4781 RepID=A0A0P1AZ99_PLAHL|nr:uncharacterized protein PHALS_03262 [Plasmopara halstedii]CEG46655.1 hypothetical protein PHALS_03262 [Plasmopara halstedii]|eukprot:XP_024583024.1 hypothetical protein PHALS_03262 [Plasmopara halstedii]
MLVKDLADPPDLRPFDMKLGRPLLSKRNWQMMTLMSLKFANVLVISARCLSSRVSARNRYDLTDVRSESVSMQIATLKSGYEISKPT